MDDNSNSNNNEEKRNKSTIDHSRFLRQFKTELFDDIESYRNENDAFLKLFAGMKLTNVIVEKLDIEVARLERVEKALWDEKKELLALVCTQLATDDSEGHQLALKREQATENTIVESAQFEHEMVLQELIATLKAENAVWAKEMSAMQKENAAMKKTIDDLAANAN